MAEFDNKKWDFFICHASEDKEAVARPLATALRDKGYQVWYDEWTLRLGDSLRRKIENGLVKSKYGIVILSPNFFQKEWPQTELNGLFGMEMFSKKRIILPVWHNISEEHIVMYSPFLADRFAALTAKGIPSVVESIEIAVSDVQSADEIASNSSLDNVRWEKVANIFWISHDLVELFRWLLTGIPKEWIDVGLRQSCFHLRELGISGSIREGLENLRDESAKFGETELLETDRERFARELRIHFNALAQLTQEHQNRIGKFDSGPG